MKEIIRYSYVVSGSYAGAIPWEEYYLSCKTDIDVLTKEIEGFWDDRSPEYAPHYVSEIEIDD